MKKHLVLFIKGLAMGAADVIPGVSGGTIAFITGIYQKLIDSLSAIDYTLIKEYKQNGFSGIWRRINGAFLLSLFSGIAVSIVSLAKLITWLMDKHPVLLWSFFFGLIAASVWFIFRQIKHKNIPVISGFVAGAFAAWIITNLSPAAVVHPSGVYLFFSGALAICAMILPGISGSFILVILGSYRFILNAIHQYHIYPLIWVAAGAVFGLLAFVKLLKYLFHSYPDITLGVLAGFVAGALNKIWPWKNGISSAMSFPVKTHNVMPWYYTGEAHVSLALGLMLAGFALIVILEQWGKKQ